MDPLRPFAVLIRSLWESKRTARTSPAARGAAVTAEQSSQSPRSTATEPAAPDLRTRLRERLDPATLADPQRARETFVAVVLESELGDAATADEDLREIARRVAEQLGEDPTIGARLHDVLRETARR
jgi:hypothetical protein